MYKFGVCERESQQCDNNLTIDGTVRYVDRSSILSHAQPLGFSNVYSAANSTVLCTLLFSI